MHYRATGSLRLSGFVHVLIAAPAPADVGTYLNAMIDETSVCIGTV